MNSQSDNKSSNAALQKLKQTTAESMRTVTETPYLPIVYGIPKEDWRAMLEYLKAASEFQPTLYARFNELAAVILIKEDWNTLIHSLNGWANAVGEEVESAAKKTEDQMRKNLHGEPRTPVTGWEDERSIFLRFAPGSQWPDWGDGGFTFEDEEVDSVDTAYEYGTDCSSEPAYRIADGMSIAAQTVELVAELSDLEDRRPIEDCTTLPQKRERRRWEQSM